MNLLDIIFVVVLGYTAIRGLFRGLILEVASLGGVVLGIYLAVNHHEEIGEPLSRVITNPDWVVLASYLLVFVATILLVSFAAGLLSAVVKKTVAAWLNYLGGLAFGVLKGGLICAVVFWLLVSVLPESEMAKNSRAAPYLMEYAAILEQYVPDSVRSMIPDTPKRPSAPNRNGESGDGGEAPSSPQEESRPPGYEPYGPIGPSDRTSTPI
jgi:membrane protein required for colicin V production